MSISLISLFARGAIVLALALVATRLARRAPAAMRHGLLAAALLAILVLPAIALIVPTWHAGAFAPAAAADVVRPEQPIAEHAVAGPSAPQIAGVAAPAPASLPWGTILTALWLAGVGVGLARVAVGSFRARRIANRALRAGAATDSDAHARAAWDALGGRGQPPRVVVSAEVEAPIVVGAIAPVVVVPRASATWSAPRWRVVLLHELAHVRRRDGIANLIARIACSVYWPNPLAWIATARLRAERELAADDAVLRDGTRASTYAEHLVAIASAAHRRSPAAVLAMAAPSRFESRLVALLDRDRSRGTIGALRGVALAAGCALVTVAAACVSPEAAPAGTTPGSAAPTPAAKDPALQAAAEAELDHAMTANSASGAIAIVLDAKTGAPLALATRGDGDVRAARAPGSTMKPFVFAAALDAGVADSNTFVDCENGAKTYGTKTLHDASPHGVLDLASILAVSSNVCTAKLAEPLGDRLGEALRRYHFAAPAHIDTHTFEGAAISAGEGVNASALDLASGYTAFANEGAYHAADGSSGTSGEHVISAQTAHAMMALLANAVDDPKGTGKAARITGVRVAGKTGTAHSSPEGKFYASFIGIVPADAPRFVVLVAVDGVTGSGGEVAAPVFAAIATKALAR